MKLKDIIDNALFGIERFIRRLFSKKRPYWKADYSLSDILYDDELTDEEKKVALVEAVINSLPDEETDATAIKIARYAKKVGDDAVLAELKEMFDAIFINGTGDGEPVGILKPGEFDDA